jgi:CubicO group peptidase (beta-lactamase class C family)
MRLLCSVAFVLLLAAPAVAQPAATQPATAQDAARLEDFVQAAIQKRNFMGTVLVARGDEILLNKGYGQANAEWNIPNTPATKFRLGSLTKQFTAASILLLEERGKLAITDPVSKHMPDAPAAWSARVDYAEGLSADYTDFTDFKATASRKPAFKKPILERIQSA